MLTQLYIQNIAVIEQASIDFEPGFTVLTGETGAGKSIIIDAIYAVLGERTSKELVRTGAEQASVSALFTDVSPQTQQVLRELDIPRQLCGRIWSACGVPRGVYGAAPHQRRARCTRIRRGAEVPPHGYFALSDRRIRSCTAARRRTGRADRAPR